MFNPRGQSSASAGSVQPQNRTPPNCLKGNEFFIARGIQAPIGENFIILNSVNLMILKRSLYVPSTKDPQGAQGNMQHFKCGAEWGGGQRPEVAASAPRPQTHSAPPGAGGGAGLGLWDLQGPRKYFNFYFFYNQKKAVNMI